MLEHRFLRGEELVAEAVIRSRFLKHESGTVTSQELLELLGRPGTSPELPPVDRRLEPRDAH